MRCPFTQWSFFVTQLTTPFDDLERLDVDYNFNIGSYQQLATVTVKYDRLGQGPKVMGAKLKNSLEAESRHRLEMKLVKESETTSAVLFVNLDKTNAKLVVKTPDGQVWSPYA